MHDQEIEVRAVVHAPIDKVWTYYTEPEHITRWAFADDTWEAPHAENDVRVGGRFLTTMAAKDKSAAFDFTGSYTEVKEKEYFAYTIDDGRKVQVQFVPHGDSIEVIIRFDMEHENSREMQHAGWQAILNNFKKYVETS